MEDGKLGIIKNVMFMLSFCSRGVFTNHRPGAKDLTFQTKISDSIWREHKNTVGISDFVEAII